MANKRLKRVIVLTDMVRDMLTQYQRDVSERTEWEQENPDAPSWRGPVVEHTPTEIKRLMLVLRQETIKLSKEL